MDQQKPNETRLRVEDYSRFRYDWSGETDAIETITRTTSNHSAHHFSMPETVPPPTKPEVEPKPSEPKRAPKPSPFKPDWPADRPLPQPKGKWTVDLNNVGWTSSPTVMTENLKSTLHCLLLIKSTTGKGRGVGLGFNLS